MNKNSLKKRQKSFSFTVAPYFIVLVPSYFKFSFSIRYSDVVKKF